MADWWGIRNMAIALGSVDGDRLHHRESYEGQQEEKELLEEQPVPTGHCALWAGTDLHIP